MQREDVLGQALQLLEIQGIASTTLEMVADRIDVSIHQDGVDGISSAGMG